MKPRAFRFGVLAESVRDKRSLDHLARRAVDAGVSTLLIRDHFIAPPFGEQLAPLTTLAHVAATSSLRIGTLVLDNDYRHPIILANIILAKEAATLDLLSEGRLELGLGAGWLRDEYATAGLPFDRAGVRIDRLAESITILKALLAGEAVTFQGAHYGIDGHQVFPRPVQQPRPPLMIGAGEPRMLALAGREADIVSVMSSSVASGALRFDPATRTLDRFAAKVARVRAAAGPRFDQIELSLNLDLTITDDPVGVTTAIAARHHDPAWTAAAVMADPAIAIGAVADVVATLRERRQALGVSYLVIGDEELAAAAPVIAELAGT